jgi:hypothetical protein
MGEEINRAIASDISVISIALMAITFILISLAWKGINTAFLAIESSKRIEVLRKGVIAIIPFILLLTLLITIGIKAKNIDEFDNYIICVLIGFVVFIIICIFLEKLIKHIPKLLNFVNKIKHPFKMNTPAEGYCISLYILGLSVFFNIFSLFYSIIITLDINYIPVDVEDFNTIKWTLIDSIISFTLGILFLARVHLKEMVAKLKNDVG